MWNSAWLRPARSRLSIDMKITTRWPGGQDLEEDREPVVGHHPLEDRPAGARRTTPAKRIAAPTPISDRNPDAVDFGSS